MSESAAAAASVSFGTNPWSKEEKQRIEALLGKHLDEMEMAVRPGPGGQALTYVPAAHVIQLANDIFGVSGWSSEIKEYKTNFVDIAHGGQPSVCVTAKVRVTLKDGCFHEDLGIGIGKGEKAAAFEKAQKEAATDALKRVLRLFGNGAGNSIYNKRYLASIAEQKMERQKQSAPHPPPPPPPPPRPAVSTVGKPSPIKLREPTYAEIERAQHLVMGKRKAKPEVAGFMAKIDPEFSLAEEAAIVAMMEQIEKAPVKQQSVVAQSKPAPAAAAAEYKPATYALGSFKRPRMGLTVVSRRFSSEKK